MVLTDELAKGLRFICAKDSPWREGLTPDCIRIVHTQAFVEGKVEGQKYKRVMRCRVCSHTWQEEVPA